MGPFSSATWPRRGHGSGHISTKSAFDFPQSNFWTVFLQLIRFLAQVLILQQFLKCHKGESDGLSVKLTDLSLTDGEADLPS